MRLLVFIPALLLPVVVSAAPSSHHIRRIVESRTEGKYGALAARSVGSETLEDKPRSITLAH